MTSQKIQGSSLLSPSLAMPSILMQEAYINDKWAMVMVIRMRRSFQSNSKISSNLSISGLYRCSLGGKKKKQKISSGRRIEYT